MSYNTNSGNNARGYANDPHTSPRPPHAVRHAIPQVHQPTAAAYGAQYAAHQGMAGGAGGGGGGGGGGLPAYGGQQQHQQQAMGGGGGLPHYGYANQGGFAGNQGRGDQDTKSSRDPEGLKSYRARERERHRMARKYIAKEELEGLRAELFQGDFDGMLIACGYEPVSMIDCLLPYLGGSAQIAVHSPLFQPLVEAHALLRGSKEIVNLSLTEPWLRRYQVLPGRTHPEMNTSASAGYILHAIRVLTDEMAREQMRKEEKRREREKEQQTQTQTQTRSQEQEQEQEQQIREQGQTNTKDLITPGEEDGEEAEEEEPERKRARRWKDVKEEEEEVKKSPP